MIQKIIAGLTTFTALVHLYLAIGTFGSGENQTLAVLFLLNFIGYLVLIGTIFFVGDNVRSHTLLGISLAVYAFITIIAYVLVNYQGSIGDLIDPVGILTKLAELALIVLIYFDIRSYESSDKSIKTE